MSHECPRCSQWCYCDGEDSPAVTAEWVFDNCRHPCEPEHDDDDLCCFVCGVEPCTCPPFDCRACGYSCAQLCIDDTCRKGECCCTCHVGMVTPPRAPWWKRLGRWLRDVVVQPANEGSRRP